MIIRVHVKIFVAVLAAAMMAVFAIGCGSSATSTPVTQAVTEAPKQVFRLKFTAPVAPPPFLLSDTMKWWGRGRCPERRSNRVD